MKIEQIVNGEKITKNKLGQEYILALSSIIENAPYLIGENDNSQTVIYLGGRGGNSSHSNSGSGGKGNSKASSYKN